MERNRAFLGCIILALLVASLVSCDSYQESYRPFPDTEGLGSIKLPPQTRHETQVGLYMDAFVSQSTRQEVEAFYVEYFASLKPVQLLDSSGRLAYYDETQGLVFFEIAFDENSTGLNRFWITYDIYYPDQYVDVFVDE